MPLSCPPRRDRHGRTSGRPPTRWHARARVPFVSSGAVGAWSPKGVPMTPGDLPVVWSLPPEDARAGRRALWWTVGPSGELAVMLVHQRNLHRSPYVRGWVGWRVVAPCDGVLVVISDGVEHRTRVTGITASTGHLALLSWSRFLLASSRTCRDGNREWENNAMVYSRGGYPMDHLCIGDDIDYVLTDRHGGIWTSYGDEGIHGSHPASSEGLARWDTDGARTWGPLGRRRLPVLPLGGIAGATEATSPGSAGTATRVPSCPGSTPPPAASPPTAIL